MSQNAVVLKNNRLSHFMLVAGFKHVLFSIFYMWCTHIFQDGWNHQPEMFTICFTILKTFHPWPPSPHGATRPWGVQWSHGQRRAARPGAVGQGEDVVGSGGEGGAGDRGAGEAGCWGLGWEKLGETCWDNNIQDIWELIIIYSYHILHNHIICHFFSGNLVKRWEKMEDSISGWRMHCKLCQKRWGNVVKYMLG